MTASWNDVVKKRGLNKKDPDVLVGITDVEYKVTVINNRGPSKDHLQLIYLNSTVSVTRKYGIILILPV